MFPNTLALPQLSPLEKTRYSRQIILPEVGMDGQRRLKAARVLVIGAGGLGSPSSMYLAAAGVGTIGLVDFDSVDLTNLQRQILHSTSNVGFSKLTSACNRLAEINTEIAVIPHNARLSAENAAELIGDYDLVVDGSDNFATRYVINDACVLLKKANVYGSVYRFEGQASVFLPGAGPCYRCLFPDPPPPGAVPNCAEGGVLGVLAGLIGVIQATEAIKLILGLKTSLAGKLLLYDALDMRFDVLNLPRDEKCPICGNYPEIRSLSDIEVFCAQGPSTAYDDILEIVPKELSERLHKGTSIVLLDVRNPDEFQLCNLPGSVLIPLAELPARMNELDQSAEIVVYCKSGGRSRSAAATLAAAGFKRLYNLRGGILAWITEVDPTMPSY